MLSSIHHSTFRHRANMPAMYAKPRSYSASYLETDVDTGGDRRVTGVKEIRQTDLDQVHRGAAAQRGYDYYEVVEYLSQMCICI